MKRFLLHCLLAGFVTIFPAAAQILPGRAIQITIAGVPTEEKGRIDAMYPVSEAGNITMPYIGTVKASGKLAEELAYDLQQRYKSAGIYTEPIFHIIDSNAKTIDQQTVFLGGDIRRPGPVPFTRGLTLYQAIQAAGGINEFGSMKRIALFRNGKRTEHDLTDAKQMNTTLEPNDTIDIPRRGILRP